MGPPWPAGPGHGLLERLLASRAEDDVGALLDEAGRDATTDPTTRAGDERDLASEAQIHGASLEA